MEPNKAGQKVPIYAHGGDPVGGIDLFVQMGNAPGNGLDPAGPRITDVDILTGTIFQNNSVGIGFESWDGGSFTVGDGAVVTCGFPGVITWRQDSVGYLVVAPLVRAEHPTQ